MSDATVPRTEDAIPVPEYEVSQYFPKHQQFPADQREQLRTEYGRLRTYYKLRRERYVDLQRWLNQARMGLTYDVYLVRSVRYGILATLLGIAIGLGLTWLFVRTGIIADLRSPVALPGGVATVVEANRVLIIGAVVTLASAATLGLGTYVSRFYYPRFVVSGRRRNVDVVLPHAITYMYAQSHGGMNLVEVVRSMARATDTYGEVANEFDMIVRDMDLFGNDLLTAIRNARNLTPSDNLEQFLDDLLGVIDAGGDVTNFFEDQSANYLEQAQEEQEDFLETLSILSEVFIVGFIAAPLFLIVTLMVISFLGGSSIPQLAAIIYVGLPLGMVGFLVLVAVLSSPYVQPHVTLDVGDTAKPPVSDDLRNDSRYAGYAKSVRFARTRAFLDDPIAAIRTTPLLSLVFSIPVAVAFVGTLLVQGIDVSPAGFAASPVQTTLAIVVVPLLVLAVPLSLFHEYQQRRERSIERRFPDTLNTLSSANYMGIPMTEALELVARWTTGALASELRKIRNDIDWNEDVSRALAGAANRLDIPQVSRSLKLVADAAHATGDMSRILSVAAEDARNRHRLERARRRAMSSYLGIVIIGFFVYLMVVVLIDTSYLGPIARQSADVPADSGLPISFTRIPVDTYRALFFHSALIQGFGSGLLAGKLADNDVLSGLKYGIGLVALAAIVFAVI
jgi:flagellar protein FlaJ